MALIDIPFTAGLDFSTAPTSAPGKWNPTLEMANKLNREMLKNLGAVKKIVPRAEPLTSTATNPQPELPLPPVAAPAALEVATGIINWKLVVGIACGLTIGFAIGYLLAQQAAPSVKEDMKKRQQQPRRF